MRKTKGKYPTENRHPLFLIYFFVQTFLEALDFGNLINQHPCLMFITMPMGCGYILVTGCKADTHTQDVR